MNKYISKYIHIFFTSESKFSVSLIKEINNYNNRLKSNEHTFVVLHKELYELVKGFNNVILDTNPGNMYLRYGNSCKWLISHSSVSKWHLLTTPASIRKKIIYRYWGNSATTCLTYNIKNPVKLLSNKIKIFMFQRLYSSFAAIGVANSVDIIDISRILQNGKFYLMPYFSREHSIAFSLANNAKKTQRPEKKEVLTFLVGHRGTSENKHIEYIKKLINLYGKSRIKILVPLSYGDDDYISSVKNEISQIDGIQITILEHLISIEDYINLLNSIDVAIFPGKLSYALGNIEILLKLQKCIVLERNGIIATAFDRESIPYLNLDDLDKFSLNDYLTKIDYSHSANNTLQLQNIEFCIDAWRKLLHEFK